MNFSTRLSCLCLLAAGTAVPALATAHNYNYVEGGYISRDLGADDDSGLRIAGSADIAPAVAVFGEYSDVGDLSQLSVGGLYHQPLQRGLDWMAGVSLEQVDAGRRDETGLGLRAGLRWTAPDPRFEVTPEIRYFDAFDDANTSLRVGGLFAIARPFQLQAALQMGDDDRLEAGARYNF